MGPGVSTEWIIELVGQAEQPELDHWESTWWKEKDNATKLSSDLHVCTRAHAHALSLKKKKKEGSKALLFLPFLKFGFMRKGFSVSLVILELTLNTKLASNSEIPLPLPPECGG